MQLILAESLSFVLLQQDEDALLRHKSSGVVINVGDHYGNATCGLIAGDESWCITGGEGFVLYYLTGEAWPGFRSSPENPPKSTIQFTNPRDLNWITSKTETQYSSVRDMRMDEPSTVRILLDPWSMHASTWRLDVENKCLTKLRDGPDRTGQPWTEEKFKF